MDHSHYRWPDQSSQRIRHQQPAQQRRQHRPDLVYDGIVNANIYEGGVLYIKANPQNPPTCCSNADGNLSGFNYDNEQFTSLPFRATFVTYFKNGYREYRTADGFGNWSGATSYYGQYADNQSNTNN